MEISKKSITIIILLITATLIFGQNMDYMSHGTMTPLLGQALRKNWVQLPNNDYVRVAGEHITSSAGWSLQFNNIGNFCVAEYNSTIYCAAYYYDTTTIGGITYPNPPNDETRVILVKINSSGTVLDSWTTTDPNFELKNIAVKDDSEIALVGHAGSSLEHLSSPIGGGVVLIHDGNSWDNTKGFFLETPTTGLRPHITDAGFLSNGNLILTGAQDGGIMSFGGIMITVIGSTDMFRGEISTTGVGVSVVHSGGLGDDYDNLQVTNASGDYMITGLYNTPTTPTTFYNADSSVGGSIDAHPYHNSRDQVYFAFYNAAGVLQNVEYAYNATVDLENVDVACSDDGFFYAMINDRGGITVTPTETYEANRLASIVLKFDATGSPVWSKKYERVGGGSPGNLGEEIFVNGDIVSVCGNTFFSLDLDLGSGVFAIPDHSSYWCEYFDGVIDPPTADFVGTPVTIVEGESVSFTNQSVAGTNQITSHNWTFGDGGTSNSTNANHTYNELGIYTVSLTVSDGDLSDTETKIDYISVENSLPTVENPITDFNFDEDTVNTSVNLNDVFWDVSLDFGEELTFSFNGNDNISVEISESGIVTLTPNQNWFGAETITFTATDNNSASVNDEVVITINPINDNPIIELPASFTFAEENQLTEDFTSYLSDIEQTNEELSLSVSGNSEIIAGINNLEVTFSATENWNGSEVLTFTVNDNQNRAVASDDIEIIVTFVNDVPTLENPIADFSFDEDTTDNSINLNNVFDDVDLVYEDELTFSFAGNDNISVEIAESGIVTLSPNANWFGSETTTFTATDNSNESIFDEVEITVESINDAPIINIDEDIVFMEDGTAEYDLNGYISDVESPNENLVLSFVGNDNIQIEIAGLQITLSSNTENWNGSEDVIFTISDETGRSLSREESSQTVTISCQPVNDAPFVENEIAELAVEEDFEDQIIELSDYFSDPDNDVLSYSAEFNENEISIIFNDSEMTISAVANWSGTALFTITADDGVNRRDQCQSEVTIVIAPINDAPEIITFSPEENEPEITEIGEVDFSVTAEDVDSEINYEWFVNSLNQDISTDSFVYDFTENGDFEIKCTVSDDEFEVETIWDVTVNLTDIGYDSLIPVTTKLVGNFPNPFNPTTIIRYDLRETGFVQINIFNIKGQKINSLVNQSQVAGKKSIVWNGTDSQNNKVGSGLYFYKLNINGKIHSMKKCVMLK